MAEVEDWYVDLYERTHAQTNSSYMVDYRDYFLVEKLLTAPYSALIVGCGTLGAPLRLLRRAKRIVGVDLSAKMLQAASRIASNLGHTNCETAQSSISEFPRQSSGEKFDFIELGVMGTYIPFDIEVVDSYIPLLKAGGIMLLNLAIIPPNGMVAKGERFRFRAPIANALSSLMFYLTGSPRHRVTISLSAVMHSVDRWLASPGNSMKLLSHSVHKNGTGPAIAYRCLLEMK